MLKINDGYFLDRLCVGFLDVCVFLEEYFLLVSFFLYDFVIIYFWIDLELRGEGGIGEFLKRRWGIWVINLGGNLKIVCFEVGYVFVILIELLLIGWVYLFYLVDRGGVKNVRINIK